MARAGGRGALVAPSPEHQASVVLAWPWQNGVFFPQQQPQPRDAEPRDLWAPGSAAKPHL